MGLNRGKRQDRPDVPHFQKKPQVFTSAAVGLQGSRCWRSGEHDEEHRDLGLELVCCTRTGWGGGGGTDGQRERERERSTHTCRQTDQERQTGQKQKEKQRWREWGRERDRQRERHPRSGGRVLLVFARAWLSSPLPAVSCLHMCTSRAAAPVISNRQHRRDPERRRICLFCSLQRKFPGAAPSICVHFSHR